jgi:predicted amidohydrolase YtcJ
VFLSSYDGHSGWANGAALAIAGIDPQTADPPLGRIGRDAHGALNGVLYEHAMALVAGCIPDPTPEELLEGLAVGQAYLHGLGITAWQDATVSADRLSAYLTAEARGLLTGRVSASLEWDELRGLEQVGELVELSRSAPDGSRVRATTVKIFQDGVIESRTAAMIEPYLDGAGRPTGEHGQRRLDPAVFAAAATALEAAGLQVHVHAIGDQAVRDALDAFEAARSANGPRDARHHVAHLQCVDPSDIPRFAELDVTANLQPYWAAEDDVIRDLTRPFVGDERTDRMYPFASLERAGARLAMGSDWNVSTADPLKLMEVAVRRAPVDGRDALPFVPSERLSLETCLRAFTQGSAYVDRLDHLPGEIAPGRAADLVVLDRDLLAPDAGPPGDARVLLTLVDGVPVHRADGLDAPD